MIDGGHSFFCCLWPLWGAQDKLTLRVLLVFFDKIEEELGVHSMDRCHIIASHCFMSFATELLKIAFVHKMWFIGIVRGMEGTFEC